MDEERESSPLVKIAISTLLQSGCMQGSQTQEIMSCLGGYRAIAGHFLTYKLSMMQFNLLLQQWIRVDLIANISTSGSSLLQGQGSVDFANENCVEYLMFIFVFSWKLREQLIKILWLYHVIACSRFPMSAVISYSQGLRTSQYLKKFFTVRHKLSTLYFKPKIFVSAGTVLKIIINSGEFI